MTDPERTPIAAPGTWWSRYGASMSGLAISSVAHATLLLAFALILIPAAGLQEALFVTTLAPIDNVRLDNAAHMEILPEQLNEREVDGARDRSDGLRFNDVPSHFSSSFNDDPIQLQLDLRQILGPNTDVNSEFAGRSEAARAALVEAFGGTSESEAAVGNGLRWLAEHQQGDGSWNFHHIHDACGEECSHPGTHSPYSIAATSLALLCYLGAGHTHQDGSYRDEVEQGLNYLLEQIRPDDYGSNLRDPGDPGMYSQGLATIVLCEAYGLSRDPLLKRPAQFAVNYVQNAQHPEDGGWRYEFRTPNQPGDTSVAGWQIMALTSAKMSGIKVSRDSLRLADRFLETVSLADGAFYGYTTPEKRPSTTAVGLLCRMYLGRKRNHPALNQGVAFLSTIGPSRQNMYYNYSATQVIHHWGGNEWTRWNAVMRDQLVNSQERDGHAAGSWSPVNSDGSHRDPHGSTAGGRHYATCFAILTLEVYYRHLPLYQRHAVEADLSVQ